MANLWLDDERTPPKTSGRQWVWAKNYHEAVDVFENYDVAFASLDHDLATEHYYAYLKSKTIETPWGLAVPKYEFREASGMEVLKWIKENNKWPVCGVRIHTHNDITFPVMLYEVKKAYGRTFQYQWDDSKTLEFILDTERTESAAD